MKCVELEKQIDSFIDDELSPSLRNKVEFHLKECRLCGETLKRLQALRGILRKDISVSASSQLDGHVMEAFSRQHAEKGQTKWWAVLAGQVVIPKPAAALALLMFAVFTGLAFQLGKMAATDIRSVLPITETVNQSPATSEPNLPSESVKESEDKTVNASVIKFIEVPVIKEKIVTRVVYVNKSLKEVYVNKSLKETDSKVRSAKSKPGSFALNSSVNENRFSTQVNLKEFQPVAEIKTQIIKKDENYEK